MASSMTPNQSLELITQMIKEARSKFEEDGFVYMLWGILLFLAAGAQYVLLLNEQYSYNYYPYFFLPLGGIFTSIYYRRRGSTGPKGNPISRVISTMWIFLGANMFILGFLFAPALRDSLIPILLILQGIGIAISGISIKSQLVITAGIIANIAGFIAFFVDWSEQPLLLSLASLAVLFIPGVILKIRYQRKHA